MADNWLSRALDAVYGALWPDRAARRRHLRRLDSDTEYREAALTALRVRGYRSADTGKGQTPWQSGGFIGRSADAEVLYDLPTLRNRSRELNRDDPLASGLTSEFVRKVVGCGLHPQARTSDREKNARMEAAFADLTRDLSPADGLSYGALQRMRLRKLIEDGEVFVKRTITDDDVILTETVEADRILTPAGTEAQSEGGSIRGGIERDRWGRTRAFYVRRTHPYDVLTEIGPAFATTSFSAQIGADQFQRVPADQVLHSKLSGRPGQTRGVPLFHAVMQDLRDLDLLLLATLKRTQIAACLAVFLESSDATTSLLDVTAEKYGYQLDQELEPGMMFKLYPGEKVSTLNPNFPTADVERFAILLARRIGAALGVSWQTVLQDWSTSNYSSARTQILEDRITYSVLREQFIADVCLPEWRWVMEWGRLIGDQRLRDVTDEDIASVQFVNDAQAWVDPEKEAKAVELKMAIGLTCLRDEAAALGKDWEDLVRQRAAEEALRAEVRAEFGLDAEEEPAGASSSTEDSEGPAAEPEKAAA